MGRVVGRRAGRETPLDLPESVEIQSDLDEVDDRSRDEVRADEGVARDVQQVRRLKERNAEPAVRLLQDREEGGDFRTGDQPASSRSKPSRRAGSASSGSGPGWPLGRCPGSKRALRPGGVRAWWCPFGSSLRVQLIGNDPGWTALERQHRLAARARFVAVDRDDAVRVGRRPSSPPGQFDPLHRAAWRRRASGTRRNSRGRSPRSCGCAAPRLRTRGCARRCPSR